MSTPAYSAAALAAQAAAAASAAAAQDAPATEKVTIPPSMAKFVDVEAELPVISVQLDALVVMKIVKHSRESSSAAGLLVGLDLDGVLEVSNSFGVPWTSEEEKSRLTGARYEAAMLRVLKEAQFDDNVVGFYQTSALGAFLRAPLVSVQATHQETLRQGGIVLVHDASATTRGNVSLRAFRLTKSFLAANKAAKFNTQSLIDNKLTFNTILEELPVTIRSSPLLTSFLNTLSSSATAAATTSTPDASSSTSSSLLPSFTALNSAPPTILSRNMDFLLDTLDSYKTEENNLAFHSRQIAREKARADAYVQKRTEENEARLRAGLTPLPEEDVSRLFKIPTEPSRLESMLLLGQMEGYAKSLEAASAANLIKLYTSQS